MIIFPDLIYFGAALFSAIGIITLVRLTWGSWEIYRVVKRTGSTAVRKLLARRNLCVQATHLLLMVLFVAVSALAFSVSYEDRTPAVRLLLLTGWVAMWGLLVMSGLLAARVQRELDRMLTTAEDDAAAREAHV